MFRRTLQAARLLALALLFPVLGVAPAAAHHVEVGDGVRQGPGPLAPTVSLQGYVDEIVVENRVTGSTTRFPVFAADDGRRFRLHGVGADAMATGTSIDVTGKIDGRVLFTESMAANAVANTRHRQAKAAPLGDYAGLLRLGHADNFDGQPSEFFFRLFTDSGGRVNIKLAAQLGVLANGMRVTASGRIAADGELIAERIAIDALPNDEQKGADVPLAAPVTTGYLVIPIKFPTNAAAPFTYNVDPFSVASLAGAVFGPAPATNVKAYYNEVSYGQQLLSGVVADNGSGGFLLANVAKPATCDIDVIMSAAETAAAARGYDVASYSTGQHGLLYVFDNVSGCGWSGLAYIGWARAYANSTSNLLVIVHELGHNFGLLHAASLDCGANVIGGACTSAEYGDPFDVMGNNRAMHFASAQKNMLGWLPVGTVATHSTGTAAYTLAPIETAGGAKYAIKVPAAPKRTYWIEYRQPVGFDSGLSAYPNNGAQIRVASPFESICTGCADDTQFLDLTPATAAFTDGALVVGKSFTDTAHGITISTVAQVSGGLSITIDSPTRPTFADVPASNPAYADIETIYWYGITLGCASSPKLFCPAGTVSRAEMAVFIERAKQGAGFVGTATGTTFADVPAGHWAGGQIEQLYADGITGGCASSPLRFCPDNKVSRAEMAIFLLRARYGRTFNPGTATGTLFADVAKTYWAAAWIERSYAFGMMPSCATGPLRFCPDNQVTRAEMATLLKNTFLLTTAPL